MTSRLRRRDALDLTWRELVWAFLPALGVLAGFALAFTYLWAVTGAPQ